MYLTVPSTELLTYSERERGPGWGQVIRSEQPRRLNGIYWVERWEEAQIGEVYPSGYAVVTNRPPSFTRLTHKILSVTHSACLLPWQGALLWLLICGPRGTEASSWPSSSITTAVGREPSELYSGFSSSCWEVKSLPLTFHQTKPPQSSA